MAEHRHATSYDQRYFVGTDAAVIMCAMTASLSMLCFMAPTYTLDILWRFIVTHTNGFLWQRY